jgi:hypothetical protein
VLVHIPNHLAHHDHGKCESCDDLGLNNPNVHRIQGYPNVGESCGVLGPLSRVGVRRVSSIIPGLGGVIVPANRSWKDALSRTPWMRRTGSYGNNTILGLATKLAIGFILET